MILPATLRIVGRQPLPPPRAMLPAQFFSGAEAGLRVEARAVVQGYRAAGSAWVLEIRLTLKRGEMLLGAILPAGETSALGVCRELCGSWWSARERGSRRRSTVLSFEPRHAGGGRR